MDLVFANLNTASRVSNARDPFEKVLNFISNATIRNIHVETHGQFKLDLNFIAGKIKCREQDNTIKLICIQYFFMQITTCLLILKKSFFNLKSHFMYLRL